MTFPEGTALVYCEGAFDTPNGKTAHGLVRFTRRYSVAAVIDSRHTGADAGTVLDGAACGIPVCASTAEAMEAAVRAGTAATHWVVGLAPDGGRLSGPARRDLLEAVALGLNVDCGLHDFLTDDPVIMGEAEARGVTVRDVRKPPPRDKLHFFSGAIEQVDCLTIAMLGTDSAIGKRTSAWILVHALEEAGYRAEMVGTGQTAWMQGARTGIILDSLVNDFVSGEIEHAVWTAWNDTRPDVIVIEGQGSLMNPAYPGGFEICAAGRPDAVLLQHAPARHDYDGFPGYPIQPLARQIQAIEMISGVPVAAVTINHENLSREQVPLICDAIRMTVGLPAFDVLRDGAGGLVAVLEPLMGGRVSA